MVGWLFNNDISLAKLLNTTEGMGIITIGSLDIRCKVKEEYLI
jgi:hypothetical protein